MSEKTAKKEKRLIKEYIKNLFDFIDATDLDDDAKKFLKKHPFMVPDFFVKKPKGWEEFASKKVHGG